MESILFDTIALTVADAPDGHVLMREWRRGEQVVHQERYRLGITAPVAGHIETSHGLTAVATLRRRLEVSDDDHETAVVVVWTMGGEVVKREAHVVLKKASVEAAAIAASLA